MVFGTENQHLLPEITPLVQWQKGSTDHKVQQERAHRFLGFLAIDPMNNPMEYHGIHGFAEII